MNSALLSLRFHTCKLEKQECSLPLSIMGRIHEVFRTIIFGFRREARPSATWTAGQSAGQFVCLVTEMPGDDGRCFHVKFREGSILAENSQMGRVSCTFSWVQTFIGLDKALSSQGTLSAVLSPPAQISPSSETPSQAHPERSFTKCQDTVKLIHRERRKQ